MQNILIFDCEIEKAILQKGEVPLEDIEYCKGWRDFKNMGVSVIGAYDYGKDRYRVFCKDNFSEFQTLVDSSNLVVSFNGLAFDNRLCDANNITIPDKKSFDILVEIWTTIGLGAEFEYPSHAGYGLNAIIQSNFPGEAKSGNGGFAPVLWQRGEIGAVIDYCLQDVRLTKFLFDKIIKEKRIINPKNGEMIYFDSASIDLLME